MKTLLFRTIRIALWAAYAAVLTLAATLICTVHVLSPGRLTPLAATVANRLLDARVSLGSAELSFRPAFPVMHLHLDSLTIISNAFADLDADSRHSLPSFADSLLTLEAFDGAIDLHRLLLGEICLRRVELMRPALNIVIDSEGRGNFDIYHPDDTVAADAPLSIPPFSISHFALSDPRAIRYYNAADSIGATVLLLGDMELDGHDTPMYAIKVDGVVANPLLRDVLSDSSFRFGLDGRVRWKPDTPGLFSFEQFTVRGECMEATADVDIVIDSTLTVTAGMLRVPPFPVADALALLPPDMRRQYFLDQIHTDATLSATARLTRPYCAATDTLPYADVYIDVPECSLRMGRADLHSLMLDMEINLRGNNPDSARVTVRRLAASGPATAIDVSGSFGRLVSDPTFDIALDADVSLDRLPPMIAGAAGGWLKGRLSAHGHAAGTASTLDADNFHRLDLRGHIAARNLYFLRNDTNLLVTADGLKIRFNSQARRQNGNVFLGGEITLDTAAVLSGGVTVRGGGLRLAAGVENTAFGSGDTTRVLPLGGRLSVARLDIESITDSAGVRIRGIDGTVGVQRFKGNAHEPLITGNLDIRRMSAGTVSNRFVITSPHIDVHMQRRTAAIRRRKQVRQLADSISRRHPYLSPDSVYALALAERRRNRHHKRRLSTAMTDEDTEMLQLELAGGFRRFLSDWELAGNLSTRSARLFTPYFPLRNRVRKLDLAFSTDSLILSGVKYTAGSSDMQLQGIISNIRRALLGNAADNTLKINLDISSDTIDVNQLASATFAGSAYAGRRRRGLSGFDMGRMSADDDDSDLDRQFDALADGQPDSVGPLLIPSNIDARINVNAKNVLYSDLLLNNLGGQLLVYGGAVNLHNLTAASDAGSLSLSALYSASKPTDMSFGFGMDLTNFRVGRFLRLMPALDSIMPMIRDFDGIINADVAATVDIDSAMNMRLPTLDAAVRLTGDSLSIIDPDTYRTLGKWLRFKDKTDNTIKHMNVELIVHDNVMQIFPFEFDIDRYRLGVAGSNDLDMNFKYHIAILKSPLPFKFGINISGNPDKYKVRFGGAKFKPGMAAESVGIVDTARVNLIRQIEGVFRRGVNNARFARVNAAAMARDARDMLTDAPDEGLTHADSLALISEGLIEAPAPADATPASPPAKGKNKGKKTKLPPTKATTTNDRKRSK